MNSAWFHMIMQRDAFLKRFRQIWNGWLYYAAALAAFLFIRLPIFMFSDAAVLAEEYARGTIAIQILQHGLSNQAFLFSDNYALGSFFAGLWISPFFMLLGHTFLALKISALVFSMIALVLWIRLFSAAINLNTGRIIGIILIFSPPLLQRYQLINMGFHTESVLFLPLTFLLVLHIINQGVSRLRTISAGFLFGLFSAYCLSNTPAVILAVCTILLYFRSARRLKEGMYLVLSGILGFSPWLWLKFSNFQGENFFPFLRTSEKTIPVILKNLYYFFHVHLPSSIFFFDRGTSYYIFLLILILIIVLYVLAFLGWREGFLYKCFLIYPALFVLFFFIINPFVPRFATPQELLKPYRYFVPMVYAFLGIFALAFNQVYKRFPLLRKPSVVFIVLSSAALVLNLWTSILATFPIHRTAYGQEPGYMPIQRNYNILTRYFHVSKDSEFLSTNNLIVLRSVINGLDPSLLINIQAYYLLGKAVGAELKNIAPGSTIFYQVADYISVFDKAERNHFLHGLACGTLPDMLKKDLDLDSLYAVLQGDDWEAFNIGLINACFRLQNQTELWSILRRLSDKYHVPVLLPSAELRPALEKYNDQISVLGYRCMINPGAIRSYINMFDKDPVSLKLLGWWLALSMACDNDKRWLHLTLGSDYADCIGYILEGMNGVRERVPFLNFFYEHSLQTYIGNAPKAREWEQSVSRNPWSFNKTIWPMEGALTKKDIEACNIFN